MTKNLEESTLPFRKGNEFGWPTDFTESGYCLSRIQIATDKNDIFGSGEFSEKLEKATKDWSFITLIKSALYFHLDSLKTSRKTSRKETNQPLFFWFDWYTLIYIFLNKNTSKKEVLEIIEFIYEAPEKETRLGVKRALSAFTAFPFVPMSPESLNNLLIFLKIDSISRDAFVKKSFKNQNLIPIVDFLITLECSVNTTLVLTDSLRYYVEALETEQSSITEIENYVNNIMECTRLELEDFKSA